MNWFETRKARALRDMREARGLILSYGDSAVAVLQRRARTSKPKSRDERHWKRVAKVVERQLGI